MSEEKCEFNMQGWCCCGLTTVPKEIGYADILCSDECNKNCYYKQLQTAKEEIIRLQSNDCFYVELDKKNELLTQQNKQMRENINNIKNLCNEDWEDMTVDKFQNQLLQAFKEVNNEK